MAMEKNLKILIVDDDKNICDLLRLYLEKDGYGVILSHDGEEAVVKFNALKPDMVLLDIMLPGMDGWQVCRENRKKSNAPIIMITAKGETIDKVIGLELGADDYIVKPFSPSEVMARVRAVLRRVDGGNVGTQSSNGDKVLKIDNLEVNLDEYQVTIGGEKVRLTKKEIETMWTLAGNPNRVFTRDNLLDTLWGYDYYGDGRTVDSHIKRLRQKIDKVDHPNWAIKTIWGVGYKFEYEGAAGK